MWSQTSSLLTDISKAKDIGLCQRRSFDATALPTGSSMLDKFLMPRFVSPCVALFVLLFHTPVAGRHTLLRPLYSLRQVAQDTMSSSLSHIPLLSILLLRAVTVVSAAAQTCYYPNGAIASDQVPCSDAQFSACCHRNAICLSNNLCMGIKQPFVLGRGACTDPDWQSEKCPQQCQTGTASVMPSIP